jgi:hypothetical protein
VVLPGGFAMNGYDSKFPHWFQGTGGVFKRNV